MNQSARIALPLLLLCASADGMAAEPATPAEGLETITVSATRLRGVPDFDVPASVDTIALDPENSRADISITESLTGVAGVQALDRQNYAQDVQLSVRGFGARSTFGVRGVRLYADGIPASMPDGQGQLSHFSALSGDRLEILRGPFSALYGNSSGGVVQLFSKDGAVGDAPRVKLTYGSNDAYTIGGQLLGREGIVGYNTSLSRFDTDGYRDHSAARRDSANARVSLNFNDSQRLNVILNYVNIPEAQDPLGQTRAQWDQDPRSAALADQYNTRKSVEQVQGGLVYEQLFGSGQSVRLMSYFGNRQVTQYLAIPIATQANPLHSGGVVDLDGDYDGADARWSWNGELAGQPFEITAGTNFDEQNQQRRGYENFIGTTLGVQGAIRRDEQNHVQNFDEFAQAWWQFATRWSLLAGVRHSEVHFHSTDHYIRTGNPDDSGGVTHTNTTPVAGLMFGPSDSLRFYVSAGKGFETPTFNELSYRADGQTGLALNLRPSTSRNYELGTKWHEAGGVSAEFALFRASTTDELAVARNVGGRSSYQNVAQARRQGLEASLDVPLDSNLDVEFAYTYVDATFESSYRICTAPPCTTPNVTVPAGARIPGVARQQGMTRFKWHSGGWNAGLEIQGSTSLGVNDQATERAPGFVIAHLEAGRNWDLSSGRLRTFARIENVLDKTYVGSVIVNEANGRYYETGLGRNYLAGLQYRF